MPILSRRLQSQYPRRQAGCGQALNVERRKRHSNAVHPAKSAVESHNLSRISSVCRQETTYSAVEHSRTQMPAASQCQPVYNMTSLPDMNYTANGSGSRTGGGSCPVPLRPMPPPSAPPLTYYSRPTVVRRRLPADGRAREREALKRQQRLQVTRNVLDRLKLTLHAVYS